MVDSTPNDALYLFCLGRSTLVDAVEAYDRNQGGTSLQTRALGELTAVIKPVDPEPWTGEAGEDNLKNIEWVGPRAVRHEEIIEAMMDASPVYPMPFGTLFSGSDRLESVIEQHREAIDSFLERVESREEWGIKGLMDRERVESHLVERAEPGEDDSPGMAYLQRQKEKRDMQERIDEWLADEEGELAERLESHVAELVDAGLQRAGDRDDDREIVYNWAALADDEQLDDLRECMADINDTYAERGLELVLSGPWPPYNFRPWSREDEADELSSMSP